MPPPPAAKSNVFATVVIAVVAAAAAAFGQGYVGPALFGTTGAVAAVGTGATAAALSSTASQLAGIGLGVQNNFSFGAVARGALVGGLSAGLTEGISRAASRPILDASGREIGQSYFGLTGRAAQAAQAAVSTTANQSVNIALGYQNNFSFAAVAASAVAAGLVPSPTGLGNNGQENPGIGSNSFSRFGNDFGRNLARNGLRNSVQIALEGGGKINIANIAGDAFGNALGNAIVGEIRFQAEKGNLSTQGKQAYEEAIANNRTQQQALAFGQAVDQNPGYAKGVLRQNGGTYFSGAVTDSGSGISSSATANSGSVTRGLDPVTGLPVIQLPGITINANLDYSSELNRVAGEIVGQYNNAIGQLGSKGFSAFNPMPPRSSLLTSKGPAPLTVLNQQLQAFNQNNLDFYANRGGLALRQTDIGGLYNTVAGNFKFGLNAAGSLANSIFVPNTVQEGVIGLAAGPVVGKGLGLIARFAPELPIIGRALGTDVGSLVERTRSIFSLPEGPLQVPLNGGLADAEAGRFAGNAARGIDPLDQYLQLAKTVDVSTAPNTAVFYSGPGNRALAEEFAAANGRITLETTPGGSYLDQQGLFRGDSPLSFSEALDVFSTLSQRYAQQASGNVFAFVNGARSRGIFTTVEYPALLQNPNVTNVITGGY